MLLDLEAALAHLFSPLRPAVGAPVPLPPPPPRPWAGAGAAAAAAAAGECSGLRAVASVRFLPP